MLLECFCLFVFILRLFHVWCFAAGVKFWRDKKNVIFLSIIVVRFLLTKKKTYFSALIKGLYVIQVTNMQSNVKWYF